MNNIVSNDHLHEQHADAIDVFGFWLYIMTDCILFASLFAAYVVLHHPSAYGPSLSSHIKLGYVFKETMCLLFSNLAYGMAMIASYRNKASLTGLLLTLTFILGLAFVGMEINEFIHLHHAGYAWNASAGASAFYTLVGTHGLHVAIGLLWIVVSILQLWQFGLHHAIKRRLVYLGLFWNFLDIIWIFVFTLVYLMGAV